MLIKKTLETNLAQLNLNLLHFDSIDSTNEEAKRRAYQEQNFESVIIADTQTNGKGRKNHKWYSESLDGLYYTICLKPTKFDFNNLYLVTKNIALLTIKVIYKITQEKIDLEWPNDLILNNKKLGGILVETILIPFEKLPKNVIVGIGLNINQANFPEELKHSAISLFQKSNKKYDKKDFVYQLSLELINFFKPEI
ncbi:MAG: biotin--[acetyl-CoA-carboxylase] ligase [Candidatus Margulisiibacteriota bacterium]